MSKKLWEVSIKGFSKDSLPTNEQQINDHLTTLARLFIQSKTRFTFHVMKYYLVKPIQHPCWDIDSKMAF